MADFVWPDWLPTAPELLPPPVDPHRIEGLANRFIAASQDALHTGPDALVGKSGADAIEAAPAVAEQLGPHAEYNHAVQELWHKNHYNPAKMTTKDAEDFIGQIKRSRDPRIAEFRDMIVDKRTEYLREPGAKPSGGKRR